jgi:hypothetical protein
MIDPVAFAMNTILAHLRPFEAGSFPSLGDHANGVSIRCSDPLNGRCGGGGQTQRLKKVGKLASFLASQTK